MRVVTDPAAMQALALDWRAQRRSIGLVPTMGFFHAGHLALMDYARELAGTCVVSLFVNPAQFGPKEDLAAYPRDFERDRALAEERGVKVLFAPEPGGMYAPDHTTWVEVPELSQGLCGASRPGHFQGVATVVAKLLTLTLPTYAVFGQKDWQQLAVIRRMARDLNLPTEIVGHEIVREPDGLALSSRNVYLSAEERAQAPAIHQGLVALHRAVAAGETDTTLLKKRFATHLTAHLPLGRIDYVQIVHPDSLKPLIRIDGPALAAVAVRVGKARLIDNMLLTN